MTSALACVDPLAVPETVRVLGHMPDSIAGLDGARVANPIVQVLGGRTVEIDVLTTGTCDVERRDTEVERQDRLVTIRPFEYRYQCGDRPGRGTLHQVAVVFDEPGEVIVDVTGMSAEGLVTRRHILVIQ